jgi:hypothetical protein
MPPEDCLWAKSWKGRTILSTGGRSRTMLMERFVPVEAYSRTAKAYSPKCLEGVFCELRPWRILGSPYPENCIAPVPTGQKPVRRPPLLDRPALHVVVLDKYAPPCISPWTGAHRQNCPAVGAMVLLLCALDFLFEHVAVSVGVTLGQISTYL